MTFASFFVVQIVGKEQRTTVFNINRLEIPRFVCHYRFVVFHSETCLHILAEVVGIVGNFIALATGIVERRRYARIRFHATFGDREAGGVRSGNYDQQGIGERIQTVNLAQSPGLHVVATPVGTQVPSLAGDVVAAAEPINCTERLTCISLLVCAECPASFRRIGTDTIRTHSRIEPVIVQPFRTLAGNVALDWFTEIQFNTANNQTVGVVVGGRAHLRGDIDVVDHVVFRLSRSLGYGINRE